MGKIHTGRIPPFDDSTYWQTGKLLFLERCIANGNCIVIGKFSACGGSNGHFAFNGNIGLYHSSTVSNAAAADGRSTGKGSIFIIQNAAIQNAAACSNNVRRSSFGALDGNFVSGILGVGFCFCAAADAGCTSAALCIFDGDIALDGRVTSAKNTAADAGTFFAAGGVADLSVASNDHIADAKSAAANAGTTIITLCIFDFGVAFNGHISDRFINYPLLDIIVIIQKALAAADACAAIAALCIFDRCVILDGYSAGTLPTTAANTGRLFAASSLFNRCIAGNCHIALTGVTAADAGTSAAAGRIFNNSAASNGHGCITARTTAADACAADSTRSPPRVCYANGIDRSAGNGNVGITASTATADTSAILAARRGNAATGDLDFTGVIEISAANARAATSAGSTQGTIAVGIGDGQFSAGFIGISLFVVLQTGMGNTTR